MQILTSLASHSDISDTPRKINVVVVTARDLQIFIHHRRINIA